MITLPESFVRTVIGVHRQKGEEWLRRFGELVAFCEQRWSLTVLQPFPLSFNFVAPAVQADGSEAVIKLGVPCAELSSEIAALRHYKGNGAVMLLDADEERGILLLERLRPGATLHTVSDEADAIRSASQVIRAYALPAPAGSAFPTIKDRARGLSKLRRHFSGSTGPIPEAMVQKAESLFHELSLSAGRLYLLHGDLHHGNILSAQRAPWLAIDPKGVIGELEYEIVPFLTNHLPSEPELVANVLRQRIELFAAELALVKSKVQNYAFSHTVLSAWWCIEDQTGGAEAALQLASIFESLDFHGDVSFG